MYVPSGWLGGNAGNKKSVRAGLERPRRELQKFKSTFDIYYSIDLLVRATFVTRLGITGGDQERRFLDFTILPPKKYLRKNKVYPSCCQLLCARPARSVLLGIHRSWPFEQTYAS